MYDVDISIRNGTGRAGIGTRLAQAEKCGARTGRQAQQGKSSAMLIFAADDLYPLHIYLQSELRFATW